MYTLKLKVASVGGAVLEIRRYTNGANRGHKAADLYVVREPRFSLALSHQ